MPGVPTAATTTEDLVLCPECQAKLVTEGDEEPWCERCQWNLDAFTPQPMDGWVRRRLERLAHHAGYDLSAALFRALVGKPVDRPDLQAATLWLAAVSGALLAFILGLAALGVWLLVYQPWLMKVVGFLLLVIAFALRPRLGSLRKVRQCYDEVTRAEAPRLFELIGRVASAAGAPVPHRVMLAPEWNAAAGTFGIRRRRVLILGLPFWSVLRSQERVALLGHELGHFANGDLRASLMTMPALTTFGLLADMLYPTHEDRDTDEVFGAFAALVQVLVRPFLLLAAHLCWLAHLGLNMIGARQSQRAEYYADELGVRVAGSQASLGLQDVIAASDGMIAVVGGRSRASQHASGWREGVEKAREAMNDRISRLRQLSLRTTASPLASHPPAGLRHALIASRPHRDARIVLSEAESAAIDAELSRYEERYRLIIAEGW